MGIFCPRLLLAAFSELVVGRHADFKGGPEKKQKLVLHRDVLKRIWGLSFTCDAYCQLRGQNNHFTPHSVTET